MEEVCAKIIVSGFVQGIGYRYFALDAALLLGIKGWVKNISGGRVESMAQGKKELVEAFIEKLREGPAYSKVTSVEADFLDNTEKLDEFKITY